MSINFKNFVKSFDLFSKPFVFFVGDKNNKKKTTFIGGLLSLSILTISIIYFYYLINMYLDHKVEPKVTSRMSFESSLTELKITENFFIFEMLINGEPLNQYQERVGKVFLTYSVNYEVSYSNGTITSYPLPLVICSDQQFKGFLCIEDKDIQNKNIFLEPILLNFTDFSLIINYCDSTLISNCATPSEIQSTIFTPTNYFQIFTKIRQYNPSNRQYENGYKSEYFYFDPYIIVYSRISLIKATTTVTEGLIIQTSETTDSIYDFKRIDTMFSKDGVEERLGLSGVGYIMFEINQVRNIIIFQHAMITEVLAQFMSIFNSLLIIGIVGQMLAQTHIVEDMNNILLKEYFKKSALTLFGSKQDSMPQAVSNNMLDAEILSHEIALLQKKIKKTNFTCGERKYFNFSFRHSVKLFFYKLLGKKFQIQRNHNNQDNQIQNDSMIYQELLNQSVKGINIYELYKDIIKLKMTIKIMLTKDQYAAIYFCGSEIVSFNKQKQILISEKTGGILETPVNHFTLDSPGKNLIKKTQEDTTNKATQCNVPPVVLGFSTSDLLKHERKSVNNYQNKRANLKNVSEEQIKCIMFDNHLEQANSYASREDFKSQITNQTKDEATKEKVLEQDKQESMVVKVNEKNNTLDTSEFQKGNQLNQKSFSFPQNMGKLFTSQSYIPKSNGDGGTPNDFKLVTLTDEEEEENQRDDQKISSIQKELQKNSNNNSMLNLQGEVVIHERSRKQKEKSKLFNFNSRISHLSEMDLIDEDPGLQEDLLKQFLLRIGQTNSQEIVNHVDRQIFQSLIRSTEGIQNNNRKGKIQSTGQNDKHKQQQGQYDQEYQPEVIFSSLGMVEDTNEYKFIRNNFQNQSMSPKQQFEEQNVSNVLQLHIKDEIN